MVQAEKKIKTSDFIIPVFVHSVKKEITKEDKEELKIIFHTAQKLTGVYPIVVLTHKTSGSLTETEGKFRDIGVERFFSFENYTREDHMKTRGKHEGVLKFLYEVIKDVQFRVDQPRDPVKEMKERKQFVLNYVLECTKKEEQRKEEKARALEKALLEKKMKEQKEEMERKRMIQKRQQEEEQRRQEQELRKMRDLQLAQQEAEAAALTESLGKKKKKKKILGIVLTK
ncbi:uncharacterized protein LOC130284947 [Hyla sarda]|uniref:uncharacterized protein LOC130284947 n=1 Tax=Hyla sarda TaxID=327740 RepID=UPI0024C31190|nr:uncharacterized protein LOC130284947 [Hyla sarda]